MKGLIFRVSEDRRDFDIVGNTQRLNYVDCKTVGFFAVKEKPFCSSPLGWLCQASIRQTEKGTAPSLQHNSKMSSSLNYAFFSLEYLCPQTLLEQWKVFSWIYGQEVPLRMPVRLHGRTLWNRWLCGQQTQTYSVLFSLVCATKNTWLFGHRQTGNTSTVPRGGTPIWKGQWCSSEILN